MYRFFDRYGKKLLAVFGVALMIVFVLPQSALTGGGGAERVVGRVTPTGDGKPHDLTAREVADAAAQLNLLQGVYVSSGRPGPDGQPQPEPIASATIGRELTRRLAEDPVGYRLLLDEADRRGVVVSDALLDQRLAGAVLAGPGLTPTEVQLLPDRRRGQIRAAARGLMSTVLSFRQAGDVAKVSRPLVDRTLAREFQKLDLSLVEFDADAYADRVSSPTDAQLQALFDAHRDETAGSPGKANPFGFGYRVPDRVKYQYVALPPGEVRRAVMASRTPFDLEVEAQKYYQQHLGDFKDRPAGQTTQPAAADAATLPFEAVKDRAIDAVVKPEVDKLRDAVLAEVRRDLGASADGSFAALESLRDAVSRKYGVELTAADRTDAFHPAADLNAEPGIGRATAILGGVGRGPGGMTIRPFADYALAFDRAAKGAASVSSAGSANALAVMKPSEPLAGGDGTEYVFRVTTADPAHAAPDLASAREQVVADARRVAAFELATADADALVAAAREGGVASAAQSADPPRTVVRTGPFDARTFGDANYALPSSGAADSADARRAFVEGAYDLLSLPPDLANPVGRIDLPTAGRVLAAGVQDVIPQWADEAERQQFAAQVESRLQTLLAVQGTLTPPAAPSFDPRTGRQFDAEPTLVEQWFAPDAIAARVGYRPAGDGATGKQAKSADAKESGAATPDAPADAPAPAPAAS